jgi:hypothetical protein
MTTSTPTKTRTIDSTDRTASLAIATAKTIPPRVKTPATRVGDTTRRLLNSLMRSLASAHV